MSPEAVLLGVLAVADIVLLAHLRQRHGRHARMERMMASLCVAVRMENDRALPGRRPWLPAS